MEEQANIVEDSAPSAIDESRRDILCILTVICFAVLPDFYNAISVWFQPGEPTLDASGDVTLWLIIRSIQVSAPTLLIVYLTDQDWESVGLKPFRWQWDPMWALGIWALSTYICLVIVSPMPESWFVQTAVPEEGETSATWLSLLVCIVAAGSNGFAEEFVMRGYILSKLEKVLQSTWQAVLISTALFASYHVYQGIGGTVDIGVYGLLLAIAFCTLRRLWPIALAHAFPNLLLFVTV